MCSGAVEVERRIVGVGVGVGISSCRSAWGNLFALAPSFSGLDMAGAGCCCVPCFLAVGERHTHTHTHTTIDDLFYRPGRVWGM